MCINSNLIDAVGAIGQGISDNQTAKQQAKVLGYEGKAALEGANYDAARIREQGQQVQGSNTVATAAAGVDVNSGSALEVAMKVARNNELDALMTSYGGQQTNWAKQYEAKQARYQGKMALINSGLKASASINKAFTDAAKASAG